MSGIDVVPDNVTTVVMTTLEVTMTRKRKGARVIRLTGWRKGAAVGDWAMRLVFLCCGQRIATVRVCRRLYKCWHWHSICAECGYVAMPDDNTRPGDELRKERRCAQRSTELKQKIRSEGECEGEDGRWKDADERETSG